MIFIFLVIYFYLRNFYKLNKNKKVFKASNLITLNKKNLNNWMNLTKKERFNLSKKDSMNYLTERKSLLNQIRNEYKKSIEKN